MQQNEMMKMRNERDENEMKSSDDCCVCYAMFINPKHLFHIHNDTMHDTHKHCTFDFDIHDFHINTTGSPCPCKERWGWGPVP